MIMIELDYNVSIDGNISFDIFVAGYTKDKSGIMDKNIFEHDIIPNAKANLNRGLEVLDLLNGFVKIAKTYKYNLKRVNSKDANPINFQLEFYA